MAGTVAVLAFLLAACTQKGGVESTTGNALKLAERIPSDARLVVLWDFEDQLDFRSWAKDIDVANQDSKGVSEFTEDLGMSLGEWSQFFDGRGFMAQSGDANQPRMYAAIGLADGAGYEAWWKKRAEGYESKGEPKEIEGVSYLVFNDSQYVGQDKDWLYLANSEEQAKTLMASVAGKTESLIKNKKFKAGLKEIGVKNSGALFFCDLGAFWEKAQPSETFFIDETTLKELKALDYMIASGNLADQEWDGFLKVKGESELGKQFLKAGKVDGSTLKLISKDVSAANSLDAEWFYKSIVKLAMAFTESRQYAGMASLAVMSQGDPWAVFQGEVSAGGNTMETLVPMLTSNFGAARKQGLTTACKSNQKNIGTALEMYSTDWSGEYPDNFELLTPNYLRTIPNCPAAEADTYSQSYKKTEDAPYYQFYCSGHHHSHLEENYPKYNGVVGIDEGPVKELEVAQAEPEEPSYVFAIQLKDAEKAVQYLGKLVPTVLEAPEKGEVTTYSLPIPEIILRMSNKEPDPVLLGGRGAKTESYLEAKEASLADNPIVSALIKESGDGVVYLDYLDMEPSYDLIVSSLEKAKGDQNAVKGLEFLKKMRARTKTLEGVSSVTATPSGLRYRSKGLLHGGTFFVFGVGGSLLIPHFVNAR